jgi:Fibronectin type III domain
VTVQGEDAAGNESGITQVSWDVQTKEIPKVTGVKAVGQAHQVALSWDASKGFEVREYKIYVSKKSAPTVFLYSIGTGKAVTSAVVKDLPQIDEDYVFFLTAIDTAGTESKEKSDGVAASPLGMRITLTPGDQSLLVEWKAVAGLSLSHYVLEYGVEEGVYTERRTIPGTAESMMLRDLLPAIEYFVRLTPIALTGQTRADLATTASGFPKGRGFAIGSSEPVPPNTFQGLHGGAPRQPVTPSVPSTGVPTTVFIIIVVASLAAFGWYMKQVKTERERTRAFLESMQNRYSV